MQQLALALKSGGCSVGIIRLRIKDQGVCFLVCYRENVLHHGIPLTPVVRELKS